MLLISLLNSMKTSKKQILHPRQIVWTTLILRIIL